MIKKILIVTVLTLSIGLSACTPTQKTPINNVYTKTQSAIYDTKTQTNNSVAFNVYFPDKDATKLIKQVVQQSAVTDKDGKIGISDWVKYCIAILISGQNTVIPKNTQILNVTLNNDLLTVDLSKDFEKDHPGGSTGVEMTMAQLVLSLTERPEVKQVAFTIEGKTLNDFKGAIQFNKPFKRADYEKLIAK